MKNKSGKSPGIFDTKTVSFSYAEGLTALNQVSLHARPGETIALVGTTGAGKSTLVNLLTRFYELTSGQIYIDEKPIREYGLRALRESIGVVTQESFLFNGSIRENLLMGRPEASEADLWRASRCRERPRFHRTFAGKIGQRGGRTGRETERRRETAALDCARAL